MSPEEASVLVVAVPEADAALAAVRRAHDPSARDGMPAHVTVLTPFVPRARWDAGEAARLAAAVAGIGPFEARFRRTGRFGSTTLFLVPEPEEAFSRLATAVAAAFPEYPPYGGAFSTVLPHLTLAHGVPEATLDELAARWSGGVDVRARIRDLVLFFRGPDGRWLEGPRLPLPPR